MLEDLEWHIYLLLLRGLHILSRMKIHRLRNELLKQMNGSRLFQMLNIPVEERLMSMDGHVQLRMGCQSIHGLNMQSGVTSQSVLFSFHSMCEEEHHIYQLSSDTYCF